MAKSKKKKKALPKTYYPATKAPSGLSIKRNGNVFTLYWKRADSDYNSGVDVQYKTSGMAGWASLLNTSATATSRSMSLTLGRLYKVEMRVQGRRKKYTDKKKNTYIPKWSGYVATAFELSAPNRPTVIMTKDETKEHTATFMCTVNSTPTDNKPFGSMEWESILVKESNEADGENLSWGQYSRDIVSGSWQHGTFSATSGSKTFTETNIESANSYTRWFRCKAKGCAGETHWRYSKRVYAKPSKATNFYAWGSSISNGYNIKAEWKTNENNARPIDLVNVEWCRVVPEANMEYTQDDGWSVIRTLDSRGKKDSVQFDIVGALDPDECIFVRINTIYDNQTTKGDANLAIIGKCAKPTEFVTHVTTSGNTYTLVVDSVTQESQVPEAFLEIYMDNTLVGIIEGYGTIKNKTFSISKPSEKSVFKCIAVAHHMLSYGYAIYRMTSDPVFSAVNVPVAPSNIKTTILNGNTVQVSWENHWDNATSVELAWADHDDAWMSTNEPSTFEIPSLATTWNIADLESGKIWYIRVRLKEETEEGDWYSDWSDMISIDLAGEPDRPSFAISPSVAVQNSVITASWMYGENDNANQTYAEVYEVEIQSDGSLRFIKAIGSVQTERHLTVNTSKWDVGTSHQLAVRVASGAVYSEWSIPASFKIVEPVTCAITQTSLVDKTITEDGVSRTVKALTAMPMTVKVTGADDNCTTSLAIERAESYQLNRPDESLFYGFEGETVYQTTQNGNAQITINQSDVYGYLDDGATYRLVAIVTDEYDQVARAEMLFEVHWNHQAVKVTATCDVIEDDYYTVLKVDKPTGWAEGDVCDIYRLSVDKPELIVEGADFDTYYVDPYPTLGEYGGHRFVYRTVNGDYITAENEIAWTDITAVDDNTLETDYGVIIDFGGNQALLYYNVDLSSRWEKDFQATKYLGGSIQGDWNPGVQRTGSIGTLMISVLDEDKEMISIMHDLAAYTGVCHVRTRDGSSFAADVQVEESTSHSTGGLIYSYSLNFTRVDSQQYDGMLFKDYDEEAYEEYIKA